jgi:hypothetical protein
MRPEGSLPVVGKVPDHARLEGNLVNPARHIAQVLRIVVDFGHPNKRAVVRPKTEPPRDCRRLQLLRDWSHDEEGIDEIRT